MSHFPSSCSFSLPGSCPSPTFPISLSFLPLSLVHPLPSSLPLALTAACLGGGALPRSPPTETPLGSGWSGLTARGWGPLGPPMSRMGPMSGLGTGPLGIPISCIWPMSDRGPGPLGPPIPCMGPMSVRDTGPRDGPMSCIEPMSCWGVGPLGPDRERTSVSSRIWSNKAGLFKAIFFIIVCYHNRMYSENVFKYHKNIQK